MWQEDVYFKRRIEYAINRQRFLFDTGELLFSADDVDAGTQLLLRYMLDEQSDPTTILDLGCGYGVIGIVLARFHPQSHVLMVDKDLLALRYAKHNAELNRVEHTMVMASVGVADIPSQPFDLIASNIPGHIGDTAIERDFLVKPVELLHPGGAYWFVVVTPLVELIERVAQDHRLVLHEIAKRSQHRVYKITGREG